MGTGELPLGLSVQFVWIARCRPAFAGHIAGDGTRLYSWRGRRLRVDLDGTNECGRGPHSPPERHLGRRKGPAPSQIGHPAPAAAPRPLEQCRAPSPCQRRVHVAPARREFASAFLRLQHVFGAAVLFSLAVALLGVSLFRFGQEVRIGISEADHYR